MYDLSLENYLKAHEIASKINNKTLVSQSENNVGFVLLKLGRFTEAQKYFEKFYQYGVEHNLKSYIAVGLNNLGEIFLKQEKIAAAQKNFIRALRISEKAKLTFKSSWSHHRLSNVYYQQQQFDKAIYHIKKAIKIREKYHSVIEKLSSQVVLAKIYFAQQKTALAIALLNNVISSADKFNNLSLKERAYTQLYTYYKKSANFAEAIKALEQKNDNKYKLLQRQTSLGLTHYLAQSNIRLKELDILELKKQNELNEERAQLAKERIIIIVATTVIIMIIMIFFFMKLNKKNKQLKQSLLDLHTTQQELIEADKMSAMTTLVSGMAHQLNTPLGVIVTANSIIKDKIALLEEKFQTKNLEKKELTNFINETKQALSLLESNSEKTTKLVQRFKMISAELQDANLTKFNVKFFIEKKLALLVAQFDEKITLEIKGDEVEIYNYPDVLFKALEQLVKNTFDHKSAASVVISLTVKENENTVDLVYRDNGVGIADNVREKIFNPFFTTKGMQERLGLGLNIAYNSVLHLMQGKFTCEAADVGAKFVISLPIILIPE